MLFDAFTSDLFFVGPTSLLLVELVFLIGVILGGEK